jgi:hypothetical protein
MPWQSCVERIHRTPRFKADPIFLWKAQNPPAARSPGLQFGEDRSRNGLKLGSTSRYCKERQVAILCYVATIQGPLTLFPKITV